MKEADHSRIYRGWVQHDRHHPRPHRFRSRIDMLYLDLDEAAGTLNRGWIWRFGPGRLFQVDPRRLFGGVADPAGAVRDRVAKETGLRPSGPVRVLTLPSVLGRGFNPVSFYYCFDGPRQDLVAVLAEITNTPWGERHAYLIPGPGGRPLQRRFPKSFHISPFLGMDLEYDWHLGTPGEGLFVRMDCRRSGGLQLRTTLRLESRPLTRIQLAWMGLRQPLMGMGVLAAIYLQAATLRLKGIPFHPHPRGKLRKVRP